MSEGGARRQVTRVSAYAVCVDEARRILWHELYTNLAGEPEDYHGIRVLYRCRITGGELRDEADGSTDAARWFAPSELPADPLVDIAELAVRLVL